MIWIACPQVHTSMQRTEPEVDGCGHDNNNRNVHLYIKWQNCGLDSGELPPINIGITILEIRTLGCLFHNDSFI